MISDWMETVSYAARAFVTSGQADTTKHAVAKENKIFIHAKCSIYKPFFLPVQSFDTGTSASKRIAFNNSAIVWRHFYHIMIQVLAH